MTRLLIQAKEFDTFAQQHCHRWNPQTIAAARSCLVDGEQTQSVAERFGITANYLVVLRARFLKIYANPPVKVVATSFMRGVMPEGLPGLKPFRKEIQRLLAAGYSEKQVAEYLRQNNVKVKAGVLRQFLRGLQAAQRREIGARTAARANKGMQ